MFVALSRQKTRDSTARAMPNLPDLRETRLFWEQYYSGLIDGDTTLVEAPSPFAVEVSSKIPTGSTLLDFGCGNGRDSCFFASQGLVIIATDICTKAVELTASKLPLPSSAIVADGSSLPETTVDYAYLRFVLHALTETEQDIVFRWMRKYVRKQVFIETRSTKDPRCGQGKLVGRNEYIDTHYRRFLSTEDLVAAASRVGFSTCEVVETSPGSGNDGAQVLRAILG